ncbi:hypothetical protein P0H77_04285 [Superficieibacter sp. HKU1]|nr:hypothetical protein P0H77_04285 [Superficieibacter sp. HKU1]
MAASPYPAYDIVVVMSGGVAFIWSFVGPVSAAPPGTRYCQASVAGTIGTL